MKHTMRKKLRPGNLILKTILVLMAAIFALPLYITLINIFKPTKLISASPMALPIPPVLDNIINILNNPNIKIGHMYFNSICITGFRVVICILISSMAAYYIVRTKKRLRNIYISIFCLGLWSPM